MISLPHYTSIIINDIHYLVTLGIIIINDYLVHA